jgi:peptidoglycan/LPS O-acetylase OafA/YrhL
MEQIRPLQGIRFLAILGVFLCHTVCFLDIYNNSLFSCLGASGVFTFFMISGFLLSKKNRIVEKKYKFDIFVCAWKRVNKYYELYIITFLLALIAKYPTTFNDFVLMFVKSIFALTLTQSFVPHVGIVNSFNGPAWFLSALFGIWIINYSYPRLINHFSSEVCLSSCLKIFVCILICQWGYLFLLRNLPYNLIPTSKEVYYNWLSYYNPFFCYSVYVEGVLLGRFCSLKLLDINYQKYLQFFVFIIAIIILFNYEVIKFYVPLVVITELLVFGGVCSVLSRGTIGESLLSSQIAVYLGNISAYIFLIHGVVNYNLRSYLSPFIQGGGYLFIISAVITLFFSIITDQVYKKRNQIIYK